jgi:hypothetical protein
MDDGGRTGTGIHLNTNAFSLSDVERLCHILNDKFNLKCTIHSPPPLPFGQGEGRNLIYIWKESVSQFIELVSPHIHSSMLYKITT